MTDAATGPVPEVTHALDYNVFTSALYNLDFKGPGRLTIRADGPTYVFSGKPRGLLAAKSGELVFRPEDVVNVTVLDRTVRFKTSLGRSGEKDRPFVFHLRDAAEAAAVAELLPRTQDAEFTEVQDFTAKLGAVAGSQSPVTSPTNVIIALNVAVFVVMGSLGAGWLETASLMPYVLYGANNGAATTDGEWWRLLTSMFMHYGIMHLLLNMWALYQAGRFMEKVLGRWPYVLAYLGSGLAGGFASIGWHGDQSWSAGASGAVFGVYGAILGYMLREKQALPKSIYQSMLKSTLSFAGYNILYGFARAGIDNAAHVGGLLGGIAFGWLLALPLDAGVRAQATGRRLQLGLAVLGGVVVLGITLTPRFDYRISEVIAWEETNREFLTPEIELIKQNRQSLTGPDREPETAAYADWLETKLVPFYDNWGRKLRALQLSPDKRTAQVRAALVHIFDLRMDSYRHLATGLRQHDTHAREQFTREDAAVVAEITKLQEANKE